MSETVIPARAQCCTKVFRSGGSWGGEACKKPPKVAINGKFYCATHDPAAEAKRKAANDARYEAWSARSRARWKAKEAREASLAALRAALRQEGPWSAVEEAGAAMLAAETQEGLAEEAYRAAGGKD